MKFFIDTANIEQIKSAAAMGVLDGVTTNPSLAAKETAPYKDLLVDICKIVPGPVSAEVLATDYDGMMKEARKLIYAKFKFDIEQLLKQSKLLKQIKTQKKLTGFIKKFSNN